jgi:hypothetical protein
MDTPQPQPQPAGAQPTQLEEDFARQSETPSWRALLSRPSALVSIVVALLLAGVVVYLEFVDPHAGLPIPEVSYALMPNEGKTTGVPIAIKLNQVTVFEIDDPMEGGAGASRTPAIVERLQNAVSDLRANPGKAVTYVTEGGNTEIVLQNVDGTERRLLIRIAEGDLALTGNVAQDRVARVWAERLTDALKVLAFGEAPEFSKGTDYGNAIESLYALAKAGGRVSKGSLDDAFAQLNDSQRLALETVPALPAASEPPPMPDAKMPQVSIK